MERQIMSAREMDLALARIAAEIVEKHSKLEDLLLVGIRRRGIPLSQRLQKHIQRLTQKAVQLGILDITLYRDDLTTVAAQPVVAPELEGLVLQSRAADVDEGLPADLAEAQYRRREQVDQGKPEFQVEEPGAVAEDPVVG